MEDYKNSCNSNKSKELPEKRVKKVISGNVKTKKRSSLMEDFVSEDASYVKEYLFRDVIVPAFKNLIDDAISNGIHMILWGTTSRNKSRTPASRVNYRSYYDEPRRESRYNTPVKSRNFREIVLESRGEAETVMDGLEDCIDQYGFVSVGDLYDLVGISGDYTDNDYGWTDLKHAEVLRTRDGYVLKLPRALPLK